jgi:hypothetical protein
LDLPEHDKTWTAPHLTAQKLKDTNMKAGRDIVVSMAPQGAGTSQAPTVRTQIGAYDNKSAHTGRRFGSWNVKERFMLDGGIFKAEKGRTCVKRTVNVVIERNGTAKNRSDLSSRADLNDEGAAHHMEVAYGMKVRVTGNVDVPAKVGDESH